MKETTNQQSAESYLDEKFPKGDKRRGEAMVLFALAKLEKTRRDYSKEDDIFYIGFDEGQTDVSEEFETQDGQSFVLDYDNNGRIIGIEVFDFEKFKKKK